MDIRKEELLRDLTEKVKKLYMQKYEEVTSSAREIISAFRDGKSARYDLSCVIPDDMVSAIENLGGYVEVQNTGGFAIVAAKSMIRSIWKNIKGSLRIFLRNDDLSHLERSFIKNMRAGTVCFLGLGLMRYTRINGIKARSA